MSMADKGTNYPQAGRTSGSASSARSSQTGTQHILPEHEHESVAPPPQAFLNIQSQQGPEERTYELTIIEQPRDGCAFGDEPLSRIPISPPLIARLRIFDRDGVEVTAGDDLPFLTCQVSLLTPDGTIADLVRPATPTDPGPSQGRDKTAGGRRRGAGRKVSGRHASGSGAPTWAADAPSSSKGSGGQASRARGRGSARSGGSAPGLIASLSAPARMLAGDRPAHADIYYDLDNQRRLLFIFSEICIRLPGKFRLQLNLTRLPSSGSSLPLPSFSLARATTDIVTVVERDAFSITGPTPLMKCLQRQGVTFPVTESSAAEEERAA